MQQWLAFPWVRYALWLVTGMLLSLAVPNYGIAAAWLSVGTAFMMLLAVLLLKENKPVEQLSWGVLACAMLFSLGYWRMDAALQIPVPVRAEAPYWWVQVVEEPVLTPKTYRFRGEAIAATAVGGTEAMEVMVYLPKATTAEFPEPGQRLLLKGEVRKVPLPLNPYEFNNRTYLATQGIHYQLFARAGLSVSRKDEKLFCKSVAFKSRRYLLQVVKRFVPDASSAGVVSTMVLGQRSELDRALRQSYASAGVMHVLAVSGLHVGMVFGLLYFLFRYLQRKLWHRYVWLVLVLLILWAYAWLTGLAPSALRATIMFSIIAIGTAVRRKGNIYNSIAFSAFVLLLWNPLFLKQLGFQLSYLAVTGIVYLQPRIKQLYQPESKWKIKLWELISVTLAAQLATFPLGLYYFHQFPTYFFIGNLLAVPLAFIILSGTIFLFLFHWVPLLNTGIGYVLSWVVVGLNQWVQLTERLPSSKLVATVTASDVLLIYGSLICLLVLFRLRSFSWVVLSFSFLLAIAVSGVLRTASLRNQQYITLYQVPGHTIFQFVQGQREELVPVGPLPDEQQLQYHLEPARVQAGLNPTPVHQELPQYLNIPKARAGGVQLLVWYGKTVAVVEGRDEVPVVPEQPIAVDLLLLRKNPKVPLEKLQQVFKFKQLILDGSNSRRYRQKLVSKANSLHLQLYLTSERGAYHLPL